MMKWGCKRQFKWVVLFMVFALAGNSFSAEYRAFKNQVGKTIHARILQYDAESGRVQLELKNRKKAWIEISTLADEDQEYIKQWNQKKCSEVPKAAEPVIDETEKNLTRQEVRDIGKQYVRAVQKKDYDLWCSLFADLYEGDERLSEKKFSRLTEKWNSISFVGVDDYNIEMSIIAYNGGEGCRWLQLLPDGRIKYDFLMFLHPFEEVEDYLPILGSSADNGTRESHYNDIKRRLEEMDIPFFGYDVNAPKRERDKSIGQIAEWLLEKEEDWDVSEPKLTLPKDRYKVLMQRIKKYR